MSASSLREVVVEECATFVETVEPAGARYDVVEGVCVTVVFGDGVCIAGGEGVSDCVVGMYEK